MKNRIQILASLVAIATVTAFIPRQSRSRITPKREPVLFSTKNQEETKSDSEYYKIDGENRSIYDITLQWEAAKEGASDFWKNIIEGDDDGNEGKDDLEKRRHEEEKKDVDDLNRVIQKRDNQDHGFREESDGSVDDENRDQNEKDTDMLDPLKKLLKDDGAPQQSSPAKRPRRTFEDAANTFVALLSNKGQSSEQSIRDIVDTARESAEEGEVSDQKSFQEILELLRQYSRELRLTADKYFGTIDFSQLYPTSLFYFIEYEDEQKNPSWKRRIHRFHKGVDFKKMNSLNDALTLARLSYYETSEEVRQRLGLLKEPYELVSCDLRASEPGKPAYYLAVRKKQKKLNPALELVLGIRGTKTITDAITDLLFEATEYRNGKAHSGMLSSGQYIAEKNKHVLKTLLESSGKKKIKLKLVGHSLGAGAACIAAMEFNDENFIEPDVVGFGSPALLSRELSEEMQDYMTSVIADDDCVPRLSAPTVVNSLLDIMEFDYVPRARRDIEQALTELSRMYPLIIPEEGKDKILGLIDPFMDKHIVPSIHESTEKRMEQELFPPGRCIHFYRDGTGVSGSIVPCTFFNRLDVKRRMVLDHLFHSGYEGIFLDIVRMQYQDHNFQFENPVTLPENSNNV